MDAFERAAAAGAFGPESRVELIEGEIVTVPSMLPGHAQAVRALCVAAYRLDPDVWTVGSQLPVRLAADSAPEPDLWLAQGEAALFAGRHPAGSDLALVVEVADTSLAFDSDAKVPAYASGGVPEVWLVSLPERQITVYRHPHRAERRFDDVAVLRSGEAVAHGPSALTILVDDLVASHV